MPQGNGIASANMRYGYNKVVAMEKNFYYCHHRGFNIIERVSTSHHRSSTNSAQNLLFLMLFCLKFTGNYFPMQHIYTID